VLASGKEEWLGPSHNEVRAKDQSAPGRIGAGTRETSRKIPLAPTGLNR